MSKIYIRCADRMCFWVDSETLEPLCCSFYDAYAFSDPLPVKTMSVGEWHDMRHERWCQEQAMKADPRRQPENQPENIR